MGSLEAPRTSVGEQQETPWNWPKGRQEAEGGEE